MIMQLHIDITAGIKLGENKQEFRNRGYHWNCL